MFKQVKMTNAVVKTPINHYIIFDRSGSMYATLSKVVDDIIALLPKLNDGDTLSVAWFSSQGGEYEWFVKNHLIGPASFSFLEGLLTKYRHTVGMTCFSEVLASMRDVLRQAPAGDNNLTFLTDGHPVTNDNRAEERKTLDVLRTMFLDSALFVGYGSYYNKPFMAEMAQAANGTLVHASKPVDVREAMLDFVGEATPMVAISLSTGRAFYITGSGVYNARTDSQHTYVPANAREAYYLAEDGMAQDTAAYAYAYLLMGEGKADEAIQVMGTIGDVAFVDAIQQAFTNEEYGKVQSDLLAATMDNRLRFKRGKNTNYLPDPYAFSLMNLLELLNADGVYFLPRHDAFQYKRIGAKKPVKAGYPVFEEDPNQKSPFGTLVYHGSQANISLQATITGHVDLGPEASLYDLPRLFNCVQMRNYALVKDGILNVQKLPVIIPEDIQAKISMGAEYDKDNTFILDLTSIPIINKLMADQAVGSINAYIGYAEAELEHEAAYKVFRYYQNLLNPNKTVEGELTEQQQIFLREKGIVKGVYSPPTESPDFEDAYLAKELKITKKGFSQWPSVEKVLEAMKGNGKLNGPGLVMLPYVQQAVKMNLEDLEYHVTFHKTELRRVRRPMQEARFAIIVANKWFNDVPRDWTNGEWTVKLAEKTVQF